MDPVQWDQLGKAFPNIDDNALYISPILVLDQDVLGIRGRMPGLYNPMHQTAIYFPMFDKSTIIDGRTYMFVRSESAYYYSSCFIDVTYDTTGWT